MLELFMWVAGCSLATLLIVMALQWAYDLGVEHTEERWREAVARKDARP